MSLKCVLSNNLDTSLTNYDRKFVHQVVSRAQQRSLLSNPSSITCNNTILRYVVKDSSCSYILRFILSREGEELTYVSKRSVVVIVSAAI